MDLPPLSISEYEVENAHSIVEKNAYFGLGLGPWGYWKSSSEQPTFNRADRSPLIPLFQKAGVPLRVSLCRKRGSLVQTMAIDKADFFFKAKRWMSRF